MPLKTGGPCAVCGTRESTLWHGKKKEPEKICCHNSECERQLGYLPPLQKQVKEKAAKKRAKAAGSEEQPVDPFEPTEEERVTPKLWLATLRSIIGQRYCDPDKLSERDKRNFINIPEDVPMEDTTQYLCFGLFIEDTDDEGKLDTQWLTLSDIIHMVGVEKTSVVIKFYMNGQMELLRNVYHAYQVAARPDEPQQEPQERQEGGSEPENGTSEATVAADGEAEA